MDIETKTRTLAGVSVRVLNFKYLGPTNTKGSRVKITDKWFGQSVTISSDYRFSSAAESAVAYLLERGWAVSGVNSESGIIIMSEWDSDKQLR
tara:strand:- start:108 stop:386 length:279 start_codon:yes stop_codon:yes gene_type:complete